MHMSKMGTAAVAAAALTIGVTAAPAHAAPTRDGRGAIIIAGTKDGLNTGITRNRSGKRSAFAQMNGRGQRTVTFRWKCGPAGWRSKTYRNTGQGIVWHTLPRRGTCYVDVTGRWGRSMIVVAPKTVNATTMRISAA